MNLKLVQNRFRTSYIPSKFNLFETLIQMFFCDDFQHIVEILQGLKD